MTAAGRRGPGKTGVVGYPTVPHPRTDSAGQTGRYFPLTTVREPDPVGIMGWFEPRLSAAVPRGPDNPAASESLHNAPPNNSQAVLP